MDMRQRLQGRTGLTFMELVLAMAILSVLAAVTMPLSEIAVKRGKEMELRRALREIRSAIDEYNADWNRAVREQRHIPAIDETGYPESLEDLVSGIDWGGLYPFERKYLRRIPRDPFDRWDDGWGLRAYGDPHDSTVYGGEDVYDVYSQSDGIALDGTPYNTW
ncbi:general secretion pathway protein GspG [Geoalkalibacter ferrihydriticus DSM 17813]|uniref:General secretion pathway protein GspG n=2 Tax=Geoalkalibacter ferrihydriticus TaxID=392333 RepID=A0A0C2HHI1_9BACT|nr:general secretion pathway protein GspG [Geoalkalibacter ferrihydriticus DSM 17813]